MDALAKSSLFDGIALRAIPGLVSGLGAVTKSYDKGEMILWEGDRTDRVGILLSGRARSTKTDPHGRQVIVTLLEPGSYIGLLLAASGGRPSPVSVETLEFARVLFMPLSPLISRREIPGQERLMTNLMRDLAGKALLLHDRNDCLIRSSIRDKVLTFLAREAENAGKRAFTVRMNREAMADYLHVDRSALSRELSHMQRDGLITFHKNRFQLL